MKTLDRRSFVRHLLSAAGLAVSPLDRLAFGEWQIPAAREPRRIIVVGAGLAGLVAGYELVKAGHDVIILDAQLRPGGRVLTLREPFADGLYAEAGAARIPTAHDLTRKYASQFGLNLIPFQPEPPAPNGADAKASAQPSGTTTLGSAFWADDSLIESRDKAAAGIPIEHFDKIDGGNDRLPMAFAERLGGRIRYNSPLVRIEQDAQGIHAIIQNDSRRDTVSGDFLICAIPFTTLREVNVSPAFSPAKRRAIQQLNYAAASRIYLQSKTRYWSNAGKSGFAVTDQLQVFDATFGQPGERGIMMLYALGEPAHRMERLKPDRRIDNGVSDAERIYPGMRMNFDKGFSWCWSEVVWARAAFAVYVGDQMSTLYPMAVQPEGRVHFAGEHLSPWPGWMQGALASGLRAAREISGRI